MKDSELKIDPPPEVSEAEPTVHRLVEIQRQLRREAPALPRGEEDR